MKLKLSIIFLFTVIMSCQVSAGSSVADFATSDPVNLIFQPSANAVSVLITPHNNLLEGDYTELDEFADIMIKSNNPNNFLAFRWVPLGVSTNNDLDDNYDYLNLCSDDSEAEGTGTHNCFQVTFGGIPYSSVDVGSNTWYSPLDEVTGNLSFYIHLLKQQHINAGAYPVCIEAAVLTL